MGWFQLSIISGTLLGVGLLFARASVNYGIPSYIFVGLMGAVYAVATAIGIVFRGESIANIGKYAVLLAVIASLFFFAQNVLQYKAIPMTPILSYVFLTVTITAALVTVLYDAIRLAQGGSLASINYYQIAGLILAFVAFALLHMPSQNG